MPFEKGGGECSDREEQVACIRSGGTLSSSGCSCEFPVKPIVEELRSSVPRAQQPASRQAAIPQRDSAFEELKRLAAQCRAAGQSLTQQCKTVEGADSQSSGGGMQNACGGLANNNNSTSGRIDEMLKICRPLSSDRSEACNQAASKLKHVSGANQTSAQSIYANAVAAGQAGQQNMGALQTYKQALAENSTKNAEKCKKDVTSAKEEEKEDEAQAPNGAGGAQDAASGMPSPPALADQPKDPNGAPIDGLTDQPVDREQVSGLDNSIGGGGSDDVGDGSRKSGAGFDADGGSSRRGFGSNASTGDSEGDVSNGVPGNSNAARALGGRSGLAQGSLSGGGLGEKLADDPEFKESLKKASALRGRGLASWSSDDGSSTTDEKDKSENEQERLLDPKDARWAQFAPDLKKWFAQGKNAVKCTPHNQKSEPICVHPAAYTHVASANIFRKNGDALRATLGVTTIARNERQPGTPRPSHQQVRAALRTKACPEKFANDKLQRYPQFAPQCRG